MLSGRGLCDGLTTRPEECYRMCGVSEYDRESSTLRRAWPTRGYCAMVKKNVKVFTNKSVGTGPSSYKKRIYRAAVSQRLRNTGL